MTDESGVSRDRPRNGVGLREATRVWAYIGVNSFGGPAGQIAVMHRELVERRRWVSERRFLHALNYCMILPGPEAQQLATYVGWLMHGTRGGVIAGSLFVIPGFIAMLFLAAAYAVFGDVTWVEGLLFGLQAAVVAIVIEAVIRIGKRTLRSRALQVTAAVSFVAIAFAKVPFPYIVIGAALAGWVIGRQRPAWFPLGMHGTAACRDEAPTLLPDDETITPAAARNALRAAIIAAALWLVPVAALFIILGSENVFTQEAVLFSKSALVTFGGAYAVLGYITQEAVNRYGWISPQDMITGLGLAETTPGPLIMVVQFVGFLAAYNSPGDLPPLVAGTLGAILTVRVTFLPCFLFIFLGAPYVERLRHNTSISHALTAVGAAVAGVVLSLALWFALHTAFDTVTDTSVGPLTLPLPEPGSINLASVAISLLAALLVFRFKIGTLKVLAACAGIGMIVTIAGWT
ncbi:MAG: chromate efflux transporter [Actinomycetota bacterium]